MKLLCISLVLVLCATYSYGLMCWKCTNAANLAECENKGSLVQCQGQQSCQSVLRNHDGKITITKRCKQTKACLNTAKQCNGDQINSVCRCCCDTDKCNMGALDCVKEQVPVVAPRPTKKAAVTEAVTCPKQSAPPHGEASCSNGNKQGSTCEFRCTSPDYSIYPAGADTNQCGADGKWTKAKPCCARPCPPYFLFDAAVLHHASDARSLPVIAQIRNKIVRDNVDINYDTAKFAGMYFAEQPVVSTRYNYSEYTDKPQLLQLVDERIKPTKTVGGVVNTGEAMWYAVNYLFRAEMGARDSRVPKILIVVTDSNSTDNVLAPSMAALRDGITPYIFAIEHPDRPLNRAQMVEVAGTPDRTYFLSGENPNMLKFIEDLKASFCENPCDHVLHDHDQ